MADHIRLGIQWDILYNGALSEFKADVCAPECHNFTLGATKRVLNLDLAYHTNYSVRIHSTFKQPLNVTILRSSPKLEDRVSPVGPPKGSIGTKVSQVENVLYLSWDPPDEPNGPVDYYDLVVSDYFQRSSKNE